MTAFWVVLLKVYCSRCYSVVVETPPYGEGSILYQQYITIVTSLTSFVKEKGKKQGALWQGLEFRRNTRKRFNRS